MKKTLAFFLIIIIAVSSVSSAVGTEIRRQGENVEFILTEEKGDRKHLEGVFVDMKLSHQGNISFDVHFEPLGETKSSISFRKLSDKNYGMTRYGIDAWYYDAIDLARENEKLYEETEKIKSELEKEGSKKTLEIRMSDYFEYYPVSPDISLPGFHISHYYSPIEEKAGYSFSENISRDRGLGFVNKLQDFLKVRPLENDVRKTDIRKEENGYSYSSELVDSFNFSFSNALFEDKLYFSFYNRPYHTENGSSTTVDTSEIPGGYGIFSVPYTSCDIIYEEMKTEYSVASESSVIYLDGDTQKDILCLCLRENGRFIFKVIDRRTMTDISSLDLFSYGDEDRIYYEKFDDIFVFHKNEYELKVVKMKDDGTCSLDFSYTVPAENDFNWEHFPYESSCAFDGERLFIFTPEREYFHGEADFSLTNEILVLSENGLCYYGKWENSLGETVLYSSESFCRLTEYKITKK